MTSNQTALVDIQTKQSERRSALADLERLDTPTEAQTADRDRLDKELTNGETEFRGALAAVQSEDQTSLREQTDVEGTEYRALIRRGNLGTMIQNIVEHRAHVGAEGELSELHGLPGNFIPLDLITGGAEFRAAGTSTAPTNTANTQQPIVLPVFAMGDADFLNIPRRTAGFGDAVFPILEDRGTVVGPITTEADIPETSVSWSADLLSPGRVQTSVIVKRSDIARFPMMVESLQSSMTMALSEAVDSKTVAQVISDSTKSTQSTTDDWDSYRKRLIFDQVDGRFAPSESALKLLLGADTLSDAAVEYRTNQSDESAVDSLRRLSGGVRVSPHIAATASNKQDVIVRRGMAEDAVIALWQGVEMVDDPFSGSGKGLRELTAILLMAVKVTRPAGFKQIETKHS